MDIVEASPRTTALLIKACDGDEAAANGLMERVYDELHSLAEAFMRRERGDHTLQPTALAHEAYLRVLGEGHASFENRRHFYFVVCRAMRDILVEDARRKRAGKRGGERRRTAIEKAGLFIEPPHENMIDLDRALTKLERESPERARVVLLRFFTGLTHGETAEVLGISIPTVERRWRYAKAWLRRELAADAPGG